MSFLARFPAAFALILLALPAWAQVKIQEVKTPGGLTAWLSEGHDLPFVALEIYFAGGTSLDAPGRRGAVNLMTGLLEEGADDMDSLGFAQARDSLAAHFSFDSSTDTVSVSARFLTENRDAAVDLLAAALARPRFDQDALDRVREQVLSGLRANETDAGDIANRAFDTMTFGDHPYATDGDGTLASVAGLTRADMIAAHAATLARDRVIIAAAGDITAADLAVLLDRLLGGLPATGAPLPGPAPWNLTGGVTVIDFPSPQSVILFGELGISRDDPDFFAAFILNEVLGGGRFSARLMREVREKRGLTYGIGSYLYSMDQAHILLGQFSATNDRVAEAIAVIREEWRKAAEDGITDQELAETKTYLTGSYPLRFDGNGPIAAILAAMQRDHLTVDYVQTRNARIEAVTLQDVKRVAARLLHPDALHFIVVGQPEGLVSTP
ncbi:MAG: insulinase family protein [Rhodobacteraceae bacterium]|jgi:zinc protease|nr:insulinase family protein [Paracoccaceae bacterium]